MKSVTYNGQHDNTAVNNMIIDRKKGMEKQAEAQRQHQQQQQQEQLLHARFATMARDQLFAEAREQVLAEAREQVLAEARVANPNMMRE